jgi:hypothetical protein
MVLCGWTNSWPHILWHVLGWETRLETYPTSNSTGWPPTNLKTLPRSVYSSNKIQA